MARAKVEQVRCDRCKRFELVPVTDGPKETDFKMRFLGVEIQFEDLCFRCKEAINNCVEDIKEWSRDAKPLVGEVLPSDVIPIPTNNPQAFSSPNPHSERSRKRTK